MNTLSIMAWMQDLVAAGTGAVGALAQRCESLPGFGFCETMAGTLRTADGSEHALTFRLSAAVPQLRSYLGDGRTEVVGELTIAGLATATPLSGSLWIWPHRRIIRYELTFVSDAGEALRLAGQKDVRLLGFLRTMTTLPAELRSESGELRGRATVYFALADLPAFLRSWHAVHKLPAAAVAVTA